MSEYGLRQQDYETIKALKQEVADLRARLEKAEPIVAAARRAEKNTEPVKQINPTDWAAWGMEPPDNEGWVPYVEVMDEKKSARNAQTI